MVSKLLKERWLRLAFAKDSTSVITEKKHDPYEKCWDGYERVPGKKREEKGSCRKKEGSDPMGDENDENAFIKKAATAKSIGADKFKMGDKEYDVTMDKETAEEIVEDTIEERRVRRLIRNILLEFDKEKMNCNKPRYLKKGETGYGKKQKVVKACDKGKEKIVKFGDAKMKNKSSNKKSRTNFRNRHNCSDKKDKMAAGYWACKDW